MIRLLAMGVALAALAGPLTESSARGETPLMSVHWVDVEGGAATLIVTPAGESVLIDTGNPGRRDPDRILRAAGELGIRRIDHLITTHYHRDHFGGAAELSALIPIGLVWDNGVFDGMPNHPGKAYFEFPAESRRVIQPGDVLPLKQKEGHPSYALRCLAARKTFVRPAENAAENAAICADHRDKDRDGSDNANSIVMLLSYGDFRFFDGGDLTWNQEKRLVCPVNMVGEVDVYQVGHHGLDSSNNPVLIRTLKPRVAVMNNGVTKGCRPDVFATLTAQPSLVAIFQMHKNLRPDGQVNNAPAPFIANAKKDCDGKPIHLRVARDGKSYEVEVPATGLKRRFATRGPSDQR